MQTTVARVFFRSRSGIWLAGLAAGAAGLFAFRAGLGKMAAVWMEHEEYSHGFLIPLVALFLVWQRKNELARIEFTGSWTGVALVLFGAALNVFGSLAALYTMQQYGLLFALYGVVLTLTGWPAFRKLAAPLFILLLAIPLPEFLLNNLSARLQLVSSQIGVWFIRLFDISVYVEGNVIDLGAYKLQVAEACSGLRYLFPLMTLGFIMATLYHAPAWKRTLLFATSIPVTILMNSLRIGMIGVAYEYWGVDMANGFLHVFEGWAVFMLSAAVLMLEMILLTMWSRPRRPWREVFGVEFPARAPRDAERRGRPTPTTFIVASAALVAFAAGFSLLPQRVEARQPRSSFAEFPAHIGPWVGRRDSLQQIYLETLKLDDYIIADYLRPGAPPVNLYVAWYDSQRAGQSAHSPRTCIPGGGWQILSMSEAAVPNVQVGGIPLKVNRVLIAHGDQKQLAYYWFQQRGRVLTNEYAVKWFLFWDALTLNRTDGALVRLIVPLANGVTDAAGERELQEFARAAVPALASFIPD
jgi:exosortase D (VPLPA-CTERM-specific)